MGEVALDSLLDTLKLIPFLYITYLALEFFEHKASAKLTGTIRKGGRLGPLFGGLLGAVPQCGFSAAASTLYAGRIVTLGTLFAIFLSTSDEMLPIMISEAPQYGFLPLLKILGLKIVIGVAAGFLVDLIIRPKDDGHDHAHEICEHDRCNCGENHTVGSLFNSALIHTLEVSGYILVVTFILNVIIHFAGEEFLESIILNKPVIGEMIAGIIGLIPNCAASVVLTRVYLEGGMSFSACMSGLLVGAGTGLLVLYRTNRHIKENLKITCALYVMGVVFGCLIGLVGRLIG